MRGNGYVVSDTLLKKKTEYSTSYYLACILSQTVWMCSVLVVAKVTYGVPAWSSICSAADRMRLDSFLNQCKRLGFDDKDFSTVNQLFSDADDIFFERIMINSEHVLQPFLPDKPDLSSNLRERTHN